MASYEIRAEFLTGPEWGPVLVLAAAAAAVMLCGTMPQGAMGVFLGTAGCVLVVRRVRRTLPPGLWLAGGLWLASAGLALLPAAWFPRPAWRDQLADSGLFGPLDRVSVVPEETLFWLAIMAATLAVAFYLLANPVPPGAAAWVAAAAGVFCACYALLAMGADRFGWKLAIDAGPTFGFLVNRNHVASLLVSGAVCGAGALAEGLGRRWPLVALLGGFALGGCAWGILMESPSRGGVVALALGLGLWLVGRGRWRLPLVVSAACLTLVAGGYVVGTDNPVSQRFSVSGDGGSGVAALGEDFRLKVYRDAVAMVADFPWTGSGSGSYRYLSPLYARESRVEARTIHPESDWLMVLIEGGWFALLAAFGLLAVVLRGVLPLRREPGWDARWALICAALAVGLHGFVDVPFHRIELGWWVMGLGCVGLAPGVATGAAPGCLMRSGFVVAGLGLGVFGGKLLWAEWGKGSALPPYAPEREQQAIHALFLQGQTEPAYDRAVAAASRWPMDRVLRYQHGTMAIQFVDTDAEVDAAFRAERLLNPVNPQIAQDQGEAWSAVDLLRSADLWMEAGRRMAEIDRRAGRTEQAGLRYYAPAVARVKTVPAAMDRLRPGPDDPAEWHMIWAAASGDPALALRELGADPEFLQRLTARQRAAFAGAWQEYGRGEDLQAFLDDRPDWANDAWAARARLRARAGDHEEACRIVIERFGIVVRGGDGPGSALAGEVARLQAEKNNVAARRVVLEAVARGGAEAAEAHRLLAREAMQSGDWKTAWNELVRHIRVSGADPSFTP
jgi:hypothetical protein